MQKGLLLVCLSLLCTLQLHAQCNTYLDPYPGIGLYACETAPEMLPLEFDGYCGSTLPSGFGICPPPFCGSCENYQWFRLTGPEAYVLLEIMVLNCQGTGMGAGMQAAVYTTSDCLNFNAVGPCWSPGEQMPIYMDICMVDSSQDYYLMLDGWAGDICDYEIHVLEYTPITDPPIAEGPTSVCLPAQEGYVVTNPMPGVDYNWYIIPPDAGSVFNVTADSVDVIWNQPGNHLLCVETNNLCTGPTCLEVTVDETIVITETFEICFGDTLICGNEVITQPGIYTDVLPGSNGCDSIIICEVELLPIGMEFIPQLAVCDTMGYVIGNDTLYNSNTYTIILPDASANGCDSMVIVNLINLSVFAVIADPGDQINCNGDPVYLDGSASGIWDPFIDPDLATFHWDGPGILGSPDTAVAQIDAPGWYYLTVSAGFNGDTCTVVDSILVQLDTTYLEIVEAQICEGESYAFGGELYSESGIYQDTFMAANGCDSILELQLMVESTLITNLEDSFCEGHLVCIRRYGAGCSRNLSGYAFRTRRL